MKCGNLNFLEHSGQLQACNVTLLPLPLPSGRILVYNEAHFISVQLLVYYISVNKPVSECTGMEHTNFFLEIFHFSQILKYNRQSRTIRQVIVTPHTSKLFLRRKTG